MPRKPIVIFAAACIALAVIIAGATWWVLAQRAAPADQPVMTFGEADIGGPFQLVDQTGRQVDESILEDKWTAVFFGFTYCPDYCPTTLQTLAAVKDQLGPQAENLQIVFISVDPERDTPEALADYLSTRGFPEGVIGLTGTPEQVRAAADAYRVFYERREQTGGYTMDHSLTVYLMNPEGEFVTPLSYGMGPERTATAIRRAMEEAAA
ncbi:SCO family protein [Brevundimonas sp.]|uniref:SCO family protein n=1 Tax=Brevundimonas sp. TaxID=1871086 RepID=UPI0025DAD528|nr:SCO family protein [Brevundimonas sp.]